MHTFQKPAEVLRINARGDAMAEVGDPTPAAVLATKTLAHSLHPAFNGLLSAVQQTGIEVALECDVVFDGKSGGGRVDAPVQSEDVVSRILGQHGEGVVGAFCKEGEGYDWKIFGCESFSDLLGDVLKRRERECGEIVWCELPGA